MHILNINHILRFDEGIHISDVLIIRRGSKLSGFNHFHLHEHFNILGHLVLPSSGEASQFPAQSSYVFDRLL